MPGKTIRIFKNGDELREALDSLLRIGDVLLYHGIPHEVIDAGEQGKRVRAINEEGG